jgi:hypothetical protein
MYGTQYDIEDNWVDLSHSGELALTAEMYAAENVDPLQFHSSDEVWSNMMREYR